MEEKYDGNRYDPSSKRDISIVSSLRKRGLSNLLNGFRKRLFKLIRKYFLYCYFKIFKSRNNFLFNGKDIFYFCHLYNETFLNERAIEIPIAMEEIKNYSGKDILEVGNVLSHYFPAYHDVLDKFDSSNSVIKKDIIEFNPDKKYDLVLSISTIEHIGFDEEPKDDLKVINAVNHMLGLLKDGGNLFVTIPLGYNKNLDKIIKENRINFSHKYFFKKISSDNKWTQINQDLLGEASYNSPFRRANFLFIGVINNLK